jgi:hypothetical protein
MVLEIRFWDAVDSYYTLKFNVENNPIGALWIKKLQKTFNNDFILETRWGGFLLRKKSHSYLLSQLQNCIDVINDSFLNKEYGYYIDPISDDYTTDEHNRIHHNFQILIGEESIQNDYYQKIFQKNDINLINAIRGLNDLSHEIEESKVNMPHLFTCFISDNIEKEQLPLEVEDYFTLGNFFGYIFLHYAQIGKSWIDFLEDNDKEIDHTEIKPLKIITGEFDICFSENINPISLKKIDYKTNQKILKNLFISKLEKYGKNINDKTLRLGRVKVAEIILEEDKNIILQKLAKNYQIKSLKIIDNDHIFLKNDILYKEFDPYYQPY